MKYFYLLCILLFFGGGVAKGQTANTDIPTVIGTTTATLTGTASMGTLNRWTWYQWSTSNITTYTAPAPTAGVPATITTGGTKTITLGITGLTSNTYYYCRLFTSTDVARTQNLLSGGVENFWTLCNTPTALAASNITISSFQANWSIAGTAATSYELDVSTNIGFSSFVPGYNDLNVGAGTSYNVTGLSCGTAYYYRVRAVNGGGVSTVSSGTITTGTNVITAPVATAGTNQTCNSFQANWGAVTGAVKYRLDVSLVNTFASFVAGYNNLDVGNVTNVSVTGLAQGTPYYYRVRTEGTGCTSVSSNVITYATTTAAAPAATAATINTCNSFQANWNSASGAVKYRLDVSTVNTFATYVAGYNNLDVGNVTSYSVTGLTVSSTYYYRVRSETVEGCASVSSNTITANTIALPAAPTINTVTIYDCKSFTATWNTVASATSYELDVATDAAFTNILPGYGALNVGNVTNYSVTGLISNTPYYYRVRTISTTGCVSVNSSNGNRTTSNSIGVPAAQLEDNNTCNSFRANWNSVTGASGYRLDVSTNNTFTGILSSYNNLFVSGTNQTVTGLNINTNYYYRVRAENAGGCTSQNSSTITANTIALPSATTTLSANTINCSSFNARWNTMAGATSYQLDVATDNGFANILASYNNLDVGNVTNRSVTGLISNVTYYYRVRVVASTGCVSVNSDVRSVTTTNSISAPTAQNESNNTCNSFSANWSAASGASGYRLDVASDNGFTNILSSYTDLNVGNVTTYPVAGLSQGINYYYRVRAVTAAGCTSVNSGTITANTTVPTPATTRSANNVNCNSFSARWNAATGASSYQLDVATDNGFANILPGYNGLDVGNVTSYSVTGLISNVTYYYRISTVASAGCVSVESDVRPVTTTNSISAPTAQNESNNTCNSFTANWSAASGASGYRLDVATDNAFTNVLPSYNDLNVGNVTNYIVTGLTYSTNYYYRVSAVTGAGCTSVNSGTITANTTAPTITLTVPSAPSLSYNVGFPLNIQWSAPCLAPSAVVTIEYSINGNGGGAIWLPITTTTNTGSYSWTIPNNPSTNCYVRVTSTGVNAVSANAFTIRTPSIVISVPAASSNWDVGQNMGITWTSPGLDPGVNVKIEFWNGTDWSTVVSASTPNDGAFTWPVANFPGTPRRIRITSLDYPTITATSGDFTVNVPTTITVTAPAGGATWALGSSQVINWTTSNIPLNTRMKVEYSTNGGAYITINDNVLNGTNSGTYTWNPVTGPPSTNCLIRVSEYTTPTVNGVSGTFTITGLQVTYPNGGEVIDMASSQNITWASAGLSGCTNVKLEYSSNSGTSWSTITNSTANDGSYTWTAPSVPTSQGRIRITCTSSPTNDMSDADFTIRGIILTSPAGGEHWQTGKPHLITWTSSGVTNVRLRYYNGSSMSTIIASTAASAGSYLWTPTKTVTNANCYVIIDDVSNGAISDQSSTFTLYTLDITQPNGGETITAGANYSITWTHIGFSTIDLWYSTNGGVTFTNIANNVNAGGTGSSYTWAVPSAINSTNCLIRIESSSDANRCDTSDAVFTIGNPAHITVTSPNGGENWDAGSAHNITWTSAAISNVKLEYSIDNGVSWTTIIASTPDAAKSYSWTVPNKPSNQCLVRATDVSSIATDVSNAVFTINGVTVTAPNGGETFSSGSTQNITWIHYGGGANVNIDYSIDGGGTWTPVIAGAPNSGTYSWLIPNNPSSLCRVRVTSATVPAMTDMSDANFTINVDEAIINGTVTAAGVGLQGVLITAVSSNGGTTRSATTVNDGTYSITNTSDNKTYTVTPTFAGFTFNPASSNITNGGSFTTKTANFATLNDRTISGTCTGGLTGIQDVVITLNNSNTTTKWTTNSVVGGNYSLVAPNNSSSNYIQIAVLPPFNFAPSFTNPFSLTSNTNNHNFSDAVTGTLTTVSPSGTCQPLGGPYMWNGFPLLACDIQVADNVGFLNPIINASSFNLTLNGFAEYFPGVDLNPGGTYWWRVRYSVGSWITPVQFSTITGSLNPPTNVYTDNINPGSFTVHWDPVAGATSYNVFVEENVLGWQFYSSTSVGITFCVIDRNLADNIRFRVQAVGACSSSDWSSDWLNVTLGVVGPTVQSASTVTKNSFRANWTDISGESAYGLQISTDPGFLTTITNTQSIAPNTSYYNQASLTPNTMYYYHVDANVSGWTAWSNIMRVITLPNAPTSLAKNNIKSVSFDASWLGGAYGADHYTVEGSLTNFGSTVFSITNVTNLNQTVNSLNSSLTPNTQYYYRVISYNADGFATSDPYPVLAVKTAPSVPTTLTANPIQTTSFTANWAIDAYGSDHYELQVALSSDPSFSAPVYANLNVAGLTYNVTGLTRGTAYLFRVRGVNSDGNPGDYATSGGFSTLSIPNLTTSNGGSTVTAWENNGGAAGNPINYSVNYVLSGDFVKVSIPVNYSPSLSSNLDISATPIPVDFYFLNVLTYPTPSLAGCIPANKFGTVQITSLLAGNSTLVSSTGSGLQIPLTLPNGKYTLCWVVRDPNSGDQFAAYISTHLTVTDYLFYLEGVIPVIQPKISVLPDKPFELPINIEKIDGKQITQFSGFVVYDSSILRFKPQLYKAGSLTQNWDVAISSDREGIVNVSGKGTDPIDKNGILCKVTFDVIGSVGKVSQILLADFMLNSKPVIPVDGTVTVTADVTKVTDLRAIPTECTLQQNYPNPFNPATTITYALATDAFVTLKVYDALGREVKTLDKGNKSLGYHDIVFDAKNLTSGVYYYVLNISGKENNKLLIKKMILLK